MRRRSSAHSDRIRMLDTHEARPPRPVRAGDLLALGAARPPALLRRGDLERAREKAQRARRSESEARGPFGLARDRRSAPHGALLFSMPAGIFRAAHIPLCRGFKAAVLLSLRRPRSTAARRCTEIPAFRSLR